MKNSKELKLPKQLLNKQKRRDLLKNKDLKMRKRDREFSLRKKPKE